MDNKEYNNSVKQQWQQENEKKKKHLKRYLSLKESSDDLEREIETLTNEKISPSAKIGDGMPHEHGKVDLSDYIEAKAKLYNELVYVRYQKIICYTDISRRIENIEDEIEKRVLRLRYIRMLKWETIADMCGYTLTGIHKVHGRALRHYKL